MSLGLTHLEAGEMNGGEPLIVLHGLFGSARNWATLARRFGERRHVLALDLRGHGSSPWDPDMSFPALAGDVIRFLDDRGHQRATILGHSMGGKTAMTAALLFPQRVSRLIVVDIAPVARGAGFASLARALLAVDLHPGVTRRDVDRALSVEIPDPALRGFLAQNLVFERGEFRWRVDLETIARSEAEIIGFPDFGERRFSGPSLFIAGGRSDYVGPAEEIAIRDRFPRARIERVADAGHWLHAERPEEFARLVEAFV